MYAAGYGDPGLALGIFEDLLYTPHRICIPALPLK
jgi:hypothetical protein